MDENLLTPKYKEALEFAQASFPDASDKMLMSALNTTISYVASFNRIGVSLPSGGISPGNYYGLVFGLSGGGKSSSVNLFLDLIAPVRKEWRAKIEGTIDQAQLKDAIKSTGKARKKPVYIMKTGTGPGLAWERFLFSTVSTSFGCSFLLEDEFVDYFDGKRDKEAESLIKDCYDVGNSFAVGNKSFGGIEIKGLPQVALFLSSADSMIKDEKMYDRFASFLTDGFARRCVSFYVGGLSRKRLTLSQHEAMEAKAAKQRPVIQKYFVEMNDALEANKNKLMNIPDKVRELRHEQDQDNKDRAAVYRRGHSLPFRALEIEHRTWKITKLAIAIGAFEHPDSLVLTEADYCCASAIVEYAQESFYGFFTQTMRRETTRALYETIKESPKTKTQLREAVRGGGNKDRRWLDSELEILSEYCIDCGENLIITEEQTSGAPKKVFSILSHEEWTLLKEAKEAPPVAIEFPIDYQYLCSISKDMAKGYKTMLLPEAKFVKLLQNDKGINYSMSTYKGEHRKTENWEGVKNCLALDIDNDHEELKLEQFQKLIEGTHCVIQPTKSHGIEKNKRTVDRYRVIIPTTEMKDMTVEQYKNVVNNFCETMGISEYADMPASGDVARFFYPSPHKVIVMEGALLDWKMFDFTVQEKTTPNHALTVNKAYTGEKKNVKPEYASFFAKHQDVTTAKNKPVVCPQHDDKNPSAHVGRSAETNTLYCACSAGCETIWEK